MKYICWCWSKKDFNAEIDYNHYYIDTDCWYQVQFKNDDDTGDYDDNYGNGKVYDHEIKIWF